MLKKVLLGMAMPLRDMVHMTGTGEFRIEARADADDLDAIGAFLGTAFHTWQTTPGLTPQEREEAIAVIVALIRQVDAARIQTWTRHIVAPAGVSVH